MVVPVGQKGEAMNLASSHGISSVDWLRGSLAVQTQLPLRWHKAYFDGPGGNEPLPLDLRSGPSRFDWDCSAEALVYRWTKAILLKVLESELEQLYVSSGIVISTDGRNSLFTHSSRGWSFIF